eukprot:6211819-Pleurochrysis_carterae.AAC.6
MAQSAACPALRPTNTVLKKLSIGIQTLIQEWAGHETNNFVAASTRNLEPGECTWIRSEGKLTKSTRSRGPGSSEEGGDVVMCSICVELPEADWRQPPRQQQGQQQAQKQAHQQAQLVHSATQLRSISFCELHDAALLLSAQRRESAG